MTSQTRDVVCCAAPWCYVQVLGGGVSTGGPRRNKLELLSAIRVRGDMPLKALHMMLLGRSLCAHTPSVEPPQIIYIGPIKALAPRVHPVILLTPGQPAASSPNLPLAVWFVPFPLHLGFFMFVGLLWLHCCSLTAPCPLLMPSPPTTMSQPPLQR